MFTHLMASAPERHPFSVSAWSGLSVTLHAGILLFVVWVTSRAPEAAPEPSYGPVHFLVLPAEPAPEPLPAEAPPPAEQPPVAPLPVVIPDLPEGFQELTVPREIPPSIAPPALAPIRARDFSGEGVAGGVGRDPEPIAVDTALAPLAVEFVDQPPSVRNARELSRRMEALYPPGYRAAGIEGRAVVQLVVDREGRVENEGMTVLSATHPEFGPASMELVKLLRFEPATVNGRPVRVWVRMPVDWTVR